MRKRKKITFRANRRFRRRFQRLMKNQKVFEAQQKIIKFQKFSTICAVAFTPGAPVSTKDFSGDEGLTNLFLMMSQEAWRLFLKIGNLILHYMTKFGTYAMKFIMQHPYFSLFGVFVSCSLLLFNHLAKKFGRKFQWYDFMLATSL